MIWHHGIPEASVVFLLLFITPSGLGRDCYWKYRPLPTTDQSHRVKDLKEWILFDYLVAVPTNLKQNEFCQKLWDLHFIHRELVRMAKVSGKNLTEVIKKLMNITNFVADCKIKENNCIRFEQRNVSQFLDSIPPLFTALKHHMDRFDEEAFDFSSCTIIQCQSEYFPTPDIKEAEQRTKERTTPGTKQAEWKTEASQSSQAATSRKHYWLLPLLPTGLLLLGFVVGTKLRHRQQSLNLPFQPPEQL